MDFESAMQTFAEAWMAANRSGRVNPQVNFYFLNQIGTDKFHENRIIDVLVFRYIVLENRLIIQIYSKLYPTNFHCRSKLNSQILMEGMKLKKRLQQLEIR